MATRGRYDILVIGIGRIAAGYDAPGGPDVLTHCHAITRRSDRFSLFVHDSDVARLSEAARKWSARPVESLATEKRDTRHFDVIVVCVPNSLHGSVLRRALELRPRLIVAEKPLTLTTEESREIVEASKSAGIEIVVNFQRRYDAVVTELARKWSSGALGALHFGSLSYSKGILHNGAHAVDLLVHLVGPPPEAVKTSQRTDYSEQDPTVDGAVRFGAGWIHLFAGDESRYSIFEIDLAFTGSRFRFTHSGLDYEEWNVAPDRVFPGYFELARARGGASGLNMALASFYDDIIGHLDDGRPLRAFGAEIALREQLAAGAIGRAPSGRFIDLGKAAG